MTPVFPLPVVHSRRAFLARAGAGLAGLTLATACGGSSPREAREAGRSFDTLSAAEARTLEALGDTLLPGAAAAGIAHYVDSQLGSATPLLILRYLDFPSPFIDVYRQGLAALDVVSRSRHGRPFHELANEARIDLVRALGAAPPSEWTGPPAPLFYFATRNDALDVVYGVEEGYAKLEIPYMPHMPPTAPW